jgi:3-hydroxyisobutyrate dehydrogenase-like beta-hydroxyacid dehydrogenase
VVAPARYLNAGTCGGEDKVGPLLEFIGRAIFDHRRKLGAANVVKLAGNFLMAAAVEAMAEAFTGG